MKKGHIKTLDLKGYMTILDYEIGKVFKYELIDMNMQTEECEQFIEDKGHNITNCEWMVHKDGTIYPALPYLDRKDVENLRRIDMNMDGTREICG